MRALRALMDSSTLTEAAKKADISRKTLYTYIRKDEDFGATYRAMRDLVTLEQLDVLNEGKERATTLLIKLMDDERQPASIRIKAAQTILTVATKQHEIANSTSIAENVFAPIKFF